MREYFSEAVVLHREPAGEFDFRISLFTKRYGKILARARSARKIISKLSGHLLPGKLLDVRLVEQKGLQVVDALSSRILPMKCFDLYFLHNILPEWEREPAIWEMLETDTFSWLRALQILGWAGEHNYCMRCGTAKADFFYAESQELFCKNCVVPRHLHEAQFYVKLY